MLVCDSEEKALARQELRVIRERIKRSRAVGGDASREDVEKYRAVKAFLNELPDLTPNHHTPQKSTPSQHQQPVPDRQYPCKAALERLSRKRSKENRPYEITAMTTKEMMDEKTAVKKELGQLKAFFAGLKEVAPCQTPSLEEKEIMRDLYARYCELKARLKDSCDSDQAETPRPRESIVKDDAPDVEDRRMKLKQEKKQLQLQLHKYQDEFKRKHGRPIQTAEDRAPIRVEYRRYKELRELLGKFEEKGGNDEGV
ncbi:hypothetical protein HDU67_002243 [Dinochytrium kinnereticum]|nr:hypothetical protein HDU67_002243 [Dinochytrium kinnereticum]